MALESSCRDDVLLLAACKDTRKHTLGWLEARALFSLTNKNCFTAPFAQHHKGLQCRPGNPRVSLVDAESVTGNQESLLQKHPRDAKTSE